VMQTVPLIPVIHMWWRRRMTMAHFHRCTRVMPNVQKWRIWTRIAIIDFAFAVAVEKGDWGDGVHRLNGERLEHHHRLFVQRHMWRFWPRDVSKWNGQQFDHHHRIQHLINCFTDCRQHPAVPRIDLMLGKRYMRDIVSRSRYPRWPPKVDYVFGWWQYAYAIMVKRHVQHRHPVPCSIWARDHGRAVDVWQIRWIVVELHQWTSRRLHHRTRLILTISNTASCRIDTLLCSFWVCSRCWSLDCRCWSTRGSRRAPPTLLCLWRSTGRRFCLFFFFFIFPAYSPLYVRSLWSHSFALGSFTLLRLFFWQKHFFVRMKFVFLSLHILYICLGI